MIFSFLLPSGCSVMCNLSEISSYCLSSCSAGEGPIAAEHMGHRRGDVRRGALRLLRRLHRRAHQGLPVRRVLASGQREGSALSRTAHRWVAARIKQPETFITLCLLLCTCMFGVLCNQKPQGLYKWCMIIDFLTQGRFDPVVISWLHGRLQTQESSAMIPEIIVLDERAAEKIEPSTQLKRRWTVACFEQLVI